MLKINDRLFSALSNNFFVFYWEKFMAILVKFCIFSLFFFTKMYYYGIILKY